MHGFVTAALAVNIYKCSLSCEHHVKSVAKAASHRFWNDTDRLNCCNFENNGARSDALILDKSVDKQNDALHALGKSVDKQNVLQTSINAAHNAYSGTLCSWQYCPS